MEVSKLHVDAVWGADTLRESLEQAGAFADCSGLDYFVASHVVEHVPDLVSWLREVHAVLTTAGSLRLAVPDKRYCFDILRRTSSLADVLDAFVRKRRVPSSSRILDFALNMAPVDVGAAWRSDVRPEDLQPAYTPAQALSLAEDAEQNGTYHDVHCWVFTPESFATLMLDLCRCRLLDFGCEWLVPTARDTFEFFVAMKPERDPVAAMASWQRALDTLR